MLYPFDLNQVSWSRETTKTCKIAVQKNQSLTPLQGMERDFILILNSLIECTELRDHNVISYLPSVNYIHPLGAEFDFCVLCFWGTIAG